MRAKRTCAYTQGRLRVNRVGRTEGQPLPVYPNKPTSSDPRRNFELGQKCKLFLATDTERNSVNFLQLRRG